MEIRFNETKWCHDYNWLLITKITEEMVVINFPKAITQDLQIHIQANEKADTLRYLEKVFDYKITWAPHTNNIIAHCRSRSLSRQYSSFAASAS